MVSLPGTAAAATPPLQYDKKNISPTLQTTNPGIAKQIMKHFADHQKNGKKENVLMQPVRINTFSIF